MQINAKISPIEPERKLVLCMHSRSFIYVSTHLQEYWPIYYTHFWNRMELMKILRFWINHVSLSISFSFGSNSLHNMKIEAKKNYTLKPRVVLPDSYVKGKSEKSFEFEYPNFTFRNIVSHLTFRFSTTVLRILAIASAFEINARPRRSIGVGRHIYFFTCHFCRLNLQGIWLLLLFFTIWL